jgi:hypothetical protein
MKHVIRRLGILCRITPLAALAATAVTAVAGPTNTPPALVSETLKFFNGDSLHGLLLTTAKGEPIRWQHPQVKQPIEFAPDHVSEIILATQRFTEEPSSPNRVSVLFTNDDEMTGQLVAVDQDHLTLETRYGGRLKIRRPMIRSITPQAADLKESYTGPNSMAEWTQTDSNSGWQYRNGTLISRGSSGIYRDVKMPDVARIDFDVAWTQYLNFYFNFHFDMEKQRRRAESYRLAFGGEEVYCQRLDPNQGEQNLGGSGRIKFAPQKTSGHITILVNKPTKTITLLFNGELIKQWTDTEEYAGGGTGILFYSQSYQTKIRNIEVRAWDGRFNLGATRSPDKEDTIVFTNGDKISGQLESIVNQELSMKTAYATLKVPLARVEQILMALASTETPRLRGGNVYAAFTNGGGVTFELEKLDARTITGSSETFGSATFDRSAFNRLRFNLYDERQKKSPEDTDEF